MYRRLKCESQLSPFLSLSLSLPPSLPPSSKDVRLPREMQRAMAAEAEATREASAKVWSTPLKTLTKITRIDMICGSSCLDNFGQGGVGFLSCPEGSC